MDKRRGKDLTTCICTASLVDKKQRQKLTDNRLYKLEMKEKV